MTARRRQAAGQPRTAAKAPERRGARTAKGAPRGRRRGAAVAPPVIGVAPASVLDFVRAGGTVDLLTWVRLPDDVRACLTLAGTKVRAEFALAVAAAIRSPEGAEAVAEAADGPGVNDEAVVRRALDMAATMLRRPAPTPAGGGAP